MTSKSRPEALTLSERARPPEGETPALSMTVVDVSPASLAVGIATFRVSFADGSDALLAVNAVSGPAAPLCSWVFRIGECERHDVAIGVFPLALRATETKTKCELSNGKHRLIVFLEDATFCVESFADTQTGADLRERTVGTNRPLPCPDPALAGVDAPWEVRLESPGSDLNVGNAEQSPGLFRHAGGFGIRFGLRGGERIYGGGEDFGSIAKNGRTYAIYNCDALGVNGNYRYQSTPYFWSNRGVGLSLLSAAPSTLDVGRIRHEILTWSTSTPSLTMLVQPGGTAEQRTTEFRRITQSPAGVPDWSLGLWLSRCFYQDQREVLQILGEAWRHRIAVSAINLDARCWMRADTRTDFVWDTTRFDAFESFIPALREKGVRVCLWENPYVSSKARLFEEGAANGYFAKTRGGAPYPLDWVPDGLAGFPRPPVAGLVDFTHSGARAWWKDLHRPFLRAGVSCFKTDFGEEIPHDAHFADGSLGSNLRNVYADLYNECVTEVVREEVGHDGIVWARSGFVRMASTPVKWAGDSQTSWRALRATLRGGLGQAVGGALFWSHDIGGFYGPPPDPELYLRWAQLALWGSHVRCHGTTAREPWGFGEGVLATFREALSMRLHLMPYFRRACDAAVRDAQSFLRPLWIAYPDDPACALIEDQFLAGPDVLVAPFLEPRGGRSYYLPAGAWRDVRTGGVHDLHARGATLYAERARHIPAFARVGSLDDSLFSGARAVLRDGEALA